jgi:hypothetical protein
MERFLTNDWVTLEQSDAYDYFTELSDKEKRIYHLIDRKLLPKVVFVRLYKKEKNIVFAIKTVSWRFAKNRFFRTSVYDTLATVTPTRIYSSNIKVAGNVLCQFLKIPQTRAINKALFREILKNGKEGPEQTGNLLTPGFEEVPGRKITKRRRDRGKHFEAGENRRCKTTSQSPTYKSIPLKGQKKNL